VAVRSQCLVSLYHSPREGVVNQARFFYSLFVLLNIVAFISAVVGARRRGESFRSMLLAFVKVATELFLIIPRALVYVLLAVLWYLPEWFYRRLLPRSVKSKVRVGRRYALKSGHAVGQKLELEVIELKSTYKDTTRSRKPRYTGGAGTPSPLTDFLGIYDMLIVVTEDLHYTDVMALSCVSKSVREAVLPAEFLEQRLHAFKRYTCSDKERQGCWLCKKQICAVSQPCQQTSGRVLE
jgi:hypothetical protein